MKLKHLCLFLFIFYSSKNLAQTELFDEFYFKMPISEAKKTLKRNQKKLTNVSFGAQTAYAVRKKSLVNELLDPDKTLDEQSIRFWSKIESGRLDFTLRSDVAKAIQKMDIKQLQLYFDRLLLSEQSAKIAVTSKMSEVPEQWKILKNWQSLKQEGDAFLN